jgi:hypothetical protein
MNFLKTFINHPGNWLPVLLVLGFLSTSSIIIAQNSERSFNKEAQLKVFKDKQEKFEFKLPENWMSRSVLNGDVEQLLLSPGNIDSDNSELLNFGLIFTKTKVAFNDSDLTAGIEIGLSKILDQQKSKYLKMHSYSVLSQKKLTNGIMQEIKYKAGIDSPEYRQLVLTYLFRGECVVLMLRSTEDIFEQNRNFFLEAIRNISVN